MNANELADAMDTHGFRYHHVKKAVVMLRQQQAEIEALKKEAALQRLSDFTQEADNEPVAWLHIQGNYFEASDRQLFDYEIERGWEQKPLYTHPAKCRCCGGYGLVGNIEDTVNCPLCHGEGFENHPAKTLTDEEIIKELEWIESTHGLDGKEMMRWKIIHLIKKLEQY